MMSLIGLTGYSWAHAAAQSESAANSTATDFFRMSIPVIGNQRGAV
jgi:hypothetical protein